MLGGVLRQRLALEWWAAVVVVAVVILVVALVRLPLPLDQGTSQVLLLTGVALLLAVAVGALVAVVKVPVPARPAVPGRHRERDVAAAAVEVRHRRPVDPPELQAAAIDHARRGLRAIHLTFIGMPMSGMLLAANDYASGFGVGGRVVGAVVIALGVGGLVQSRRVQHRLDALEDDAAATTSSPH